MPLFTALLQRAREQAAGIYVRNADPAVISASRPAELRAWKAWVDAHVAYVDRDLRRAGAWLNAAEAALQNSPDILCEAEVHALWMDVLDAVDEPRSAFPHARAAWSRWFALGSGEQRDQWLASIHALLDSLAPASAARPTDAEVILEWMLDRLSRQLMHVFKVTVRLHGALGIGDGAHAMVQQMQSWIERNLATYPESARVVLQAEILEDAGNLHDALAEHRDAHDAFVQADALLSKAVEHPDVDRMRLRVRFNAANALSKLGEYDRAAAAFAALRPEFLRLGLNEPALRAQHAELINRWYSGHYDPRSLMAELDELIIAYEQQPSDVREVVLRQNLDQAYRLWLTLAAPLVSSDKHLCHRFLSQLYVLREGGVTPFLTRWRTADPQKFVLSEVAVLMERLAPLQNTLLLIVETGVQRILLATVRSGGGSMAERVSVFPDTEDLVDALINLLKENTATVGDIIDRTLPIRSAMDGRFAAACQAPWQHMPPALREQLSAAHRVILSISNFGDLDALPLELLHDGNEHIALKRAVVRAASLQQLNESLATNRVNFKAAPSALLVRAADLDGAGRLVHADPEVNEVTAALRNAGFECQVMEAPGGKEFLEALGEGYSLFHYVGHGYADERGEELLLNGREGVTAIELLGVGPLPAPICVTSSCLVGRARHLRTGFQRGVAISLLARGAPAVIAATDELPDQLGRQFVGLLYSHVLAGTTLGAALLNARQELARLGYHPAAWSALVLFGDPLASISEQHRELAWPALLLRLAATDSSDYAASAKNAVRSAGNLSAADKTRVCELVDAYAQQDHNFFSDPQQHDDIATRDVEAYLAYHILLRAGQARFAGLPPADEERAITGFVGMYAQVESLLTDSYLTITAALVAWQYLVMHPTKHGNRLLREAGRALHWLSGDPELQATRKQLEEEVAV